MKREDKQAFYSSREWRACRDSYKRMKCYICERCGNTSSKMIVHHKQYLNEITIHNPEVALNFSNLELLCIECHNKEHFKENTAKRYKVGANGEIISIGE